jgi:hypothetical protein
MASASVPNVGTRVNVQMFAQDLLAHQGLVQVESYPSSGYVSAMLQDGAGVKVAVTGDRSSVRLVLSAALHQLSAEPAPHDPSAHDLLNPEDLSHHLPEHHGVSRTQRPRRGWVALGAASVTSLVFRFSRFSKERYALTQSTHKTTGTGMGGPTSLESTTRQSVPSGPPNTWRSVP